MIDSTLSKLYIEYELLTKKKKKKTRNKSKEERGGGGLRKNPRGRMGHFDRQVGRLGESCGLSWLKKKLSL